jgi:hypothetical protein
MFTSIVPRSKDAGLFYLVTDCLTHDGSKDLGCYRRWSRGGPLRQIARNGSVFAVQSNLNLVT